MPLKFGDPESIRQRDVGREEALRILMAECPECEEICQHPEAISDYLWWECHECQHEFKTDEDLNYLDE